MCFLLALRNPRKMPYPDLYETESSADGVFRTLECFSGSGTANLSLLLSHSPTIISACGNISNPNN